MSGKTGDSESRQSVDTTQLALDRTWLAHERTLMAWVRTSASMISFGFTIYKFFQYEEGTKARPPGLLTPRDFALIMVSIGLISLLTATIAHRQNVRQLSAQLEVRRRSLAEFVAGLISVFGILVLLATLFRS